MAEDDSVSGLQAFAARHPQKPGRVLVVGAKCYGSKPDRRKLYHKAVGLDLFEGEGVDIVHDLEQPLPEEVGTFAHIDCVSVLEHVKRPWVMAENIERVMQKDATILVSVPFSWRVHDYPGDFWRMTREALPILFPNVKWRERKYMVGPSFRKMVPGKDDKEGKWIARSELVAAGVRC